MVLRDLEDNIAYASAILARNMNAEAVVCYTNTGNSARKLAALGVPCPILAITNNRRTFYQLGLVWNVHPVLVENEDDINNVIIKGIEKHKQRGNLEIGDKVVLSGGGKILSQYSVNKVFGGFLEIE